MSFDPRSNHYSIAWRPQGDYGLVVGEDGFAAKVSESGAMDIDTGTDKALLDVTWSSSGGYALVCGGGGEVLRFNHGDTSMFSISSPLMQSALHGISIKPGTDDVLAVGANGQVWE